MTIDIEAPAHPADPDSAAALEWIQKTMHDALMAALLTGSAQPLAYGDLCRPAPTWWRRAVDEAMAEATRGAAKEIGEGLT